MKISLPINMKMPTIVGIFIFISREMFVLSWPEHEKRFITSGSGHAREKFLPTEFLVNLIYECLIEIRIRSEQRCWLDIIWWSYNTKTKSKHWLISKRGEVKHVTRRLSVHTLIVKKMVRKFHNDRTYHTNYYLCRFTGVFLCAYM